MKKFWHLFCLNVYGMETNSLARTLFVFLIFYIYLCSMRVYMFALRTIIFDFRLFRSTRYASVTKNPGNPTEAKGKYNNRHCEMNKIPCCTYFTSFSALLIYLFFGCTLLTQSSFRKKICFYFHAIKYLRDFSHLLTYFLMYIHTYINEGRK